MSSTTVLHTDSGSHALQLRLADGFLSRLRGLMFAAPLRADQGMLLTACPSVHTGFMRQHLDVIYLDAHGMVTKCVADLAPWRSSTSRGTDADGHKLPRARHTLELAAGSIVRLQVASGSRLQHPALTSALAKSPQTTSSPRQRGSAMIEFTVVGPIITLLGLATLQYGLLFFEKNQVNHATFMAARAGSTGNSTMSTIQEAYVRALVPAYGGGTTAAKLAESYAKALADVATHARIEVLNPTAESFTDFNDPELSARIGNGKRVIPNGGQVFKAAGEVKPNSGQNIQDANLLKLRITHGYKPQVPLMGLIYTRFLQWQDTGTDPVNTALIASGRIPVVSHVTVQMQSDAIEDKTVSSPGPGNGGTATNPGDPPVVTTDPPSCGSIGCTAPPNEPGGGGGPGGTCDIPK
ncbi:MAG: DUF192 domain-containing protein [Herminiimonas sp.]|nr:DUF192 domain-containing protein [Herminiimonas sp.]